MTRKCLSRGCGADAAPHGNYCERCLEELYALASDPPDDCRQNIWPVILLVALLGLMAVRAIQEVL